MDPREEGPERDWDLLFPGTNGTLRSTSCLDMPFREVAAAMESKKKITPRSMRRTFQDLARAAEVKDIVTRAVSGHATDSMQGHYSTVHGEEVREGLARVVSLARFRETLQREDRESGAQEPGGVLSGVPGCLRPGPLTTHQENARNDGSLRD